MATIRMASLWKDPRTGILILRKRIPLRYRSVAGRKGDTIKLTTGTADRGEAARRLPALLEQWHQMQAEIAARWAERVAAGGTRLDTAMFDGPPEAIGSAVDARVPDHADEALRLAGITATPETREHLIWAIRPMVWHAYRTAQMATLPPTWPHVPVVPVASITPTLSMDGLFAAWKAVATVKPRVVKEAEYTKYMLATFLCHRDALRITRDDLIRWRTETIAGGLNNDT